MFDLLNGREEGSAPDRFISSITPSWVKGFWRFLFVLLLLCVSLFCVTVSLLLPFRLLFL